MKDSTHYVTVLEVFILTSVVFAARADSKGVIEGKEIFEKYSE